MNNIIPDENVLPDGTQGNPFGTLAEAFKHCSADGPGKVIWVYNPDSHIVLLEEIE